MSVQAVQKDGYGMWSRAQSYVVPAAVVTGISFVVNQLWGKVAAVAFLGVVVGVGIAFPHMVKELAEDSFYLNIARHVLIVILPFFGTYGLYGSLGIATLTALAKDFRLYSMRGQLDQINSNMKEVCDKHREEIKTARARMKEFLEKQAEINKNLQALQNVDATVMRIDTQLAVIKKKKDELDAILKQHEDKSLVRLKNTAEIKSDIATTKQRVEEIMQQFQGMSKLVSEIVSETRSVNSKIQDRRAVCA